MIIYWLKKVQIMSKNHNNYSPASNSKVALAPAKDYKSLMECNFENNEPN